MKEKEKTVSIQHEIPAKDQPCRGARRVWFKIDNEWVPKGWLMPDGIHV